MTCAAKTESPFMHTSLCVKDAIRRFMVVVLFEFYKFTSSPNVKLRDMG